MIITIPQQADLTLFPSSDAALHSHQTWELFPHLESVSSKHKQGLRNQGVKLPQNIFKQSN